MLNKRQRLTKAGDFARVAKQGRYYSLPALTIKYIPSFNKTTRFGIVVSTAVSKKAVERNLIKRRLRAILHQLSLTKAADVMVVVKKTAVGKNLTELRIMVETALEKLGLLK